MSLVFHSHGECHKCGEDRLLLQYPASPWLCQDCMLEDPIHLERYRDAVKKRLHQVVSEYTPIKTNKEE